MHLGEGIVKEIILLDGGTSARVSCTANLIPAPGQYVLAHADGSEAPLAASIFAAEVNSRGFLAAPPLPSSWLPGTQLNLRGPLGRGFDLPANAHRVALLAWSGISARLLPLIELAFKQEAAVVLVSNKTMLDLPVQIEVQPLSALGDIAGWADYMAIDVTRELLPGLQERLGSAKQPRVHFEAQVLVSTSMPCGGVAECGVCAVRSGNDWKMACKDGPVFLLNGLS